MGVNKPGKVYGKSDGLLSSYHSKIAHVAFADGSAQTISEDIDPQVLRQMITRDAGDLPADY